MTKLKPKKFLGQNFLVNIPVRERIVSACDLSDQDIVLEIGSGNGELTHLIAKNAKKVYAIEKDHSLHLQHRNSKNSTNIELINANFLKVDLSRLSTPLTVIGNVPYNISSLIIERLIEQHKFIKSAFLTVQLEFGKRLAAKPNTKDYGALTCFTQYYCQPKILFKISPGCFYPVPKVISCLIQLNFRSYPIQAKNSKQLFSIIKKAFQQRRKKIKNSLGSVCPNDQFKSILDRGHIDENSRAENLTLDNYIHITNNLGVKIE